MAVIQAADKIKVITTAAEAVMAAAGLGIHKDTLKQQNAVGKTVDTALPEIVTMMMIVDTAVRPEAAVMITTITMADMVAVTVVPRDIALPTTTMITVAEVIPVTVITTTMMTTEDTGTVDGSVILKDMQKLHVADGKTEADPTVVAMVAIAAVVIAVAVVMMMITTATVKVAAGMVIQKDMRKRLTEVGKTADTKKEVTQKKEDRSRFERSSFFVLN